MFDVAQLNGGSPGPQELETIRSLIRDHPEAHRQRLSQLLCQSWNWKNEQGLFKDMAARRLLLKLHRRGDILLPTQRRAPTNAQRGRRPKVASIPTPVVGGLLSSLLPLRLEIIPPGSEHRDSCHAWLAEHHYLGFRGTVGEHLLYLVWGAQDQPLACLVFEAAAWKVAARDQWLGWSSETRKAHLRQVANNSRFLILPGVQIAHLASHILSRVTRRLRADWQSRYGHSLALVETFVERDRFRGSCYRAANWLPIGSTQGRSRNDRHRKLHVPIKEIFVYPLHPGFRRELSASDA